MHRCLVCIGSNYNREQNLFLARKELTDLFPNIRFAPEQETSPLLLNNPALFTNQVAIFFSDEEENVVKYKLKAIETMLGRCKEDKMKERISLDIDLLSYDDRVLKPKDLARDYIIRGIKDLK